MIGFLGGPSAKGWASYLSIFLKGLSEVGYVEGRNLAIEQRWADGQYDRLPEMAVDLIDRRMSVIAAAGTPAALAAKAATKTTPIVFVTIADPVQIGLVASLRRPDGNVTGVTQLNVEIGPKLLELMHEVVPSATNIALLINPTNSNSATLSRELQSAARTLGLTLNVLNASTEADITQPSQAWSNSEPAGSWSAATHSSVPEANRSQPWRCAIRCHRFINRSYSLRRAA